MINRIASVILAGGKGSRMKSELPKVLHQVGGKPMIHRNIEKLKQVGLADFYVVVGYKSDEVKQAVLEQHQVNFARQEVPLGTNHALKTAIEVIDIASYDHIFAINGDDAALYRDETIAKYIQSHVDSGAVMSVMTLEMYGDHELGKIIRDAEGNFLNTLEKFEYQDLALDCNEINCGVYIYDAKWVAENVKKVQPNGKGEYPITDLMKLAQADGKKVNLFLLQDRNEWIGVNTPEELAYANQLITL